MVLVDGEHLLNLMQITIKDNMRMIKSMVKVFFTGQVETGTKDSIKRIIGTAMAKCTGSMAVNTMANGSTVFNMVKERLFYKTVQSKKVGSKTTYTWVINSHLWSIINLNNNHCRSSNKRKLCQLYSLRNGLRLKETWNKRQ